MSGPGESVFPYAAQILTGLFLVSVTATVAGALIAVLSARIIRCVCGLAICCLGLAGLYYYLHCPFLSLMEILIYIGAVCVTIVFAIMLAEPESENTQAQEKRPAVAWFGAAAFGVSALLFYVVCSLVLDHRWMLRAGRAADSSVRAVGVSLLTTHSLAFELISLALLVAILGALAIARPGKTKV